MELMEPLLDKGRTLYTDNFYAIVELAENLLRRKTHLVGTLRVNRKYNPASITKAKLKRGDMVVRQCQHIIVAKWKDKRDVLFLTTLSQPEMVQVELRRGKKVNKPSTVVEYNSAKGYIDLSDQMTSYCITIGKGVKWYRKVALDMLTNTAVVNSHRLYVMVLNKKISITKFRESLVTSILDERNDVDRNTVPPDISPHQLQGGQHKLVENRSSRGRCTLCYCLLAN